MSKIKIEDIKEELAREGWELLSDSYKNLEEEMTFKCPEGHYVFTSWKKMRNKFKCPSCESNIYKEQDKKILPKPKGATRILALDQATYTTGYSILDDGKLIKSGTFETNLSDEIARINMIKMWLVSMLENWQPDCVGIEGIQFQEESQGKRMSVTVFQALARLQGVILDTCFDFKIPCEICHTNVWRNHCGVKGRYRADKKRSMQLKIKECYDITCTDDEADAIGIGKYVSDKYTKSMKVEIWE